MTYRIGPYYGEAEKQHVWEILDDRGVVAELYVSLEHLEIMQIEVRQDRRRQGLARLLYETAYAQMGGIFHAPVAHRTYEGDRFAEAVGGEAITECHFPDVCVCTKLTGDEW